MTRVLDVRNLRKYYPIHRGLFGRATGQVRAVDDVSFTIDRGETLSLVGESGCGKTTTSRCILRAIAPSSGEIRFRTDSGAEIDVARLPRKALRPLRRQMKMIFQAIGLPNVDYLVYRRNEWERSPETVMDAIEQRLGFP